MSTVKGNKRDIRRVLLLGATGTIGREVNKLLVNAGYEVDAPTKKDLDLTKKDLKSWLNLLLPRIDVVINCAGYFDYNLDADYDKTMDLNFRCNWEIIDYYLHGRPKDKQFSNTNVVFLGSSAFNKSNPNYMLYGASKSALCNMVQSCGNNDILRSKNVRVNVVNPGPVHSPMAEKAGKIGENLLTPVAVAEFIMMWVETTETGKVVELHRRA